MCMERLLRPGDQLCWERLACDEQNELEERNVSSFGAKKTGQQLIKLY